ncbi:hypothetical protein GS421_09300 [Rhodococcus hoagii]|nr:hypothetical protein [Prescottella equi]
MVEGGEFDLAFSARLRSITDSRTRSIPARRARRPDRPARGQRVRASSAYVGRCEGLALALRDAIASYPAIRGCAVIASGGLSHRLPWAGLAGPARRGRDSWSRPGSTSRELVDYDVRRRQIILAASPRSHPVRRPHPRPVRRRQGRELAGYTSAAIEAEAGNGAQELRTWLMMAAMMDYIPAERIAYESIPEWLTGMGRRPGSRGGTGGALTSPPSLLQRTHS